MAKFIYGNSHFNRGKWIRKKGRKYWTMTTGPHKFGDPKNTCGYSHTVNIPESNVKKINGKGICRMGGRAYHVEVRSHSWNLVDLGEELVKSEVRDSEVGDSIEIPSNVKFKDIGNGYLAWTENENNEATSVAFIPDSEKYESES